MKSKTPLPSPIIFFNTGNIAGRDNNFQNSTETRLALVEKDIEILKKELEILKLKMRK